MMTYTDQIARARSLVTQGLSLIPPRQQTRQLRFDRQFIADRTHPRHLAAACPFALYALSTAREQKNIYVLAAKKLPRRFAAFPRRYNSSDWRAYA